MANITFNVLFLTGNSFPITVNENNTLVDLAAMISDRSGIPLNYLRLYSAGLNLYEYAKRQQTIGELKRSITKDGFLANNSKIYVEGTRVPLPVRWNYLDRVNASSIAGPMNTRRNILAQTFRNRNQLRGLAAVAQQGQLPENLERNIAMRYLGARNRYRARSAGGSKKTRKSKKSRRTRSNRK